MRETIPLFQLPKTNTEQSEELIDSPTDRACLVKIYPTNVSNSMIPLQTRRLLFGRGAHCDFELDDDFASREHAVLELHGHDWVLTDLHSTNGTSVNDDRIHEPTVIGCSDQIRMGHHIFKFLSSNHVEAMYHEAVFQMMTVDALTRCYNRRYFEDAFEREVIRTTRHGRTLGVLLIDVHHFKQVNDRYGHLVGDEVLSALAARVRGRVRGDEIFARVGGEEFAIVVVEITRGALDKIAHGICELVRETPFETAAGSVDVTVSVGATFTTGLEPVTTKELLNRADEQLYKAKNYGRNCVQIH